MIYLIFFNNNDNVFKSIFKLSEYFALFPFPVPGSGWAQVRMSVAWLFVGVCVGVVFRGVGNGVQILRGGIRIRGFARIGIYGCAHFVRRKTPENTQ